jgi:hypothetical protein
VTRYSQYAPCPRCKALADAGAEIEVADAVRYIWGDRASRWGPSECDEASETEWRCNDCHDSRTEPDFTPAEVAILDATASDYEEDEE